MMSGIRRIPGTANVMSTASTMPAAPTRLPYRAVRGEDNPLSAAMKHSAATRYPSSMRFSRVTGAAPWASAP